MSKAYSTTIESEQLDEQQQSYIDKQADDLADLPHPDMFWGALDVEIEQAKLEEYEANGVIEQAGIEQTSLGELPYYHLCWSTYLYLRDAH